MLSDERCEVRHLASDQTATAGVDYGRGGAGDAERGEPVQIDPRAVLRGRTEHLMSDLGPVQISGQGRTEDGNGLPPGLPAAGCQRLGLGATGTGGEHG